VEGKAQCSVKEISLCTEALEPPGLQGARAEAHPKADALSEGNAAGRDGSGVECQIISLAEH
jgi:hypothetical protein